MTTELYLRTLNGRERSTVKRLKEASQNSQEIVSASTTIIPGYIEVTVEKHNFRQVGIPENTRAVLASIPGVIQVLDAKAVR